MIIKFSPAVIATTALSLLANLTCAQGTAFTYQGRLTDGADPATGNYDLRFALFDAASSGAPQGSAVTNLATAVSNGLFTVTLDFGNQFPGAARWLEIGVRTNGGGAFATLSPRQQLTPTPYAITASTASNLLGALPAGQLSGVLPSAQLSGTYSSAITLNNVANSFTGNGSGLTSVNAATLGGLTSASFWKTSGNAGTASGANFLGTSDNQPLELRVNGVRALRLESGVNDVNGSNLVNIVGGSPNNFVPFGIRGATIAGGGALYYAGGAMTNSVKNDLGTIGGGGGNTITISGLGGTIGGGFQNWQNSYYGTIAGGSQNTNNLGNYSTVGGGFQNCAGDGAFAGGGSKNSASGPSSVVGGGFLNVAGGDRAFVGGGWQNQASGQFSSISGGTLNSMTPDASECTIGGGHQNFMSTFPLQTISGGYNNQAAASGAAIGGGMGNTIQYSSSTATIGGGSGNSIQTFAESATIGGGSQNSITASYATVPGGNQNTAAGSYSFAAGRQAKANHQSTFVWADSAGGAGEDFASTSTNQFLIRAGGGVGIGTNNPAQALHVIGNILVSGTVTGSSDRNVKRDFAPVNSREVLDKVTALPISTWSYIGDDGVRHLGPMAQDFYSAFSVGMNDKTISMVDADGVALAAIQGLNQKLEQKETEITELKARLEKLEKRMDREAKGDEK